MVTFDLAVGCTRAAIEGIVADCPESRVEGFGMR